MTKESLKEWRQDSTFSFAVKKEPVEKEDCAEHKPDPIQADQNREIESSVEHTIDTPQGQKQLIIKLR